MLRENVNPNVPVSCLPAPLNLARQGYRKRKAYRPQELHDLHFEISYDHIPLHFLQWDISVGERRHLLFATKTSIAVAI